MAEVPELAATAATPAVERRIVSVLFADLVGFTPLSESLDPEDVATIQDAYFSATRDTIQRYGGVLEKFIGDAAMAVFGAPRARDDDAERAVRAGLALIGALEQLEARLGLQPATLQLRVGVNTGEVVHATSGPDSGRVTGDTVNTAARLQAAARPGSVLIGELTELTVAEAIETRSIGRVELKGKADPVRAWEAVGARSQPSREEALGALRAPMIGRDHELADLHRALADAAQARSASRLVIVAPPGVGKSRLLAEFATGAEAQVLRARVRAQATAPFETVAQLLAAANPASLSQALAVAGIPGSRAAVIGQEAPDCSSPIAGQAAPPATWPRSATRGSTPGPPRSMRLPTARRSGWWRMCTGPAATCSRSSIRQAVLRPDTVDWWWPPRVQACWRQLRRGARRVGSTWRRCHSSTPRDSSTPLSATRSPRRSCRPS